LKKAPLPAVAMTGEITLTGRVLPIGGLKEKLLAAKRSFIRKVVIPARNESDLNDIPKYVTRGMEIVRVQNMDQAMENIFPKGTFRKRSRRTAKTSASKRVTGHAAK
jgi:ATP-dependent Lon protease